MILLVSPANVAGIGGGVFFVPILISIFKYDTHTAMHMSSILVFSASLLKIYFALTQKHPKRNRPSIDYNSLLIITPSLLLSVKIGVIMHSIMPEFYLLLALSAILLAVSYISFIKGLTFYRSENNAQLKSQTGQEDILISDNLESVDAQRILKQESNMFPKHKIILLVMAFLLLVVMNISIESNDYLSILGIKRCSSIYWLMLVLFIICNILLLRKGLFLVDTELKERKLYDVLIYPQDDIDLRKGIKLGVIGIIAGMLAGIFGIGGGVFVSPLLLQLGHFPEVVTNTSIILILISTGASSLQYLMMTTFSLWETNFFNIFTLLSTLFANFYIVGKIKKTGRSSIIVFVTTFVLVTSALFAIYIAIYKLYSDHDEVLTCHLFCPI